MRPLPSCFIVALPWCHALQMVDDSQPMVVSVSSAGEVSGGLAKKQPEAFKHVLMVTNDAMDASEQEEVNEFDEDDKNQYLQSCSAKSVKLPCSELNHDGQDLRKNYATWTDLARHLSLGAEGQAWMMKTLGAKGDDDIGFKCSSLCKRAVKAIEKKIPGACPKQSNTCAGEKIGPQKVGGLMAKAPVMDGRWENDHEKNPYKDGQPTEEEQQQQDREQAAKDKDENNWDGQLYCNDAEEHDLCINYTRKEILSRVANTFQVFCDVDEPKVSLSSELLLQLGDEANATQRQFQDVIKRSWTASLGWVNNAINHFEENSASAERKKWFGGRGSKSESQIKQRVAQGLNYIAKEMPRANYVMAPSSKCGGTTGGGVLAFVYSYSYPARNKGDFRAASYKKCAGTPASQFLAQACVLDGENRMIVYLCERWARWPQQSVQVSTMTHEIVHHTGIPDVGPTPYTHSQIVRYNQMDQIENAENYAAMVAELSKRDAGGGGRPPRRRSSNPPRRRTGGGGSGCSDKTPGGNACSDWKRKGYCTNQSYRGWMKANCCKTCDGGGSGGGGGANCNDKNQNCPGWKKYCGSSQYGAFMAQNCKNTCNTC